MSEVERLRRHITGTSQFVSDIYAPNMLYCVTLRSEKAHARILEIRVPDLPPGVMCIRASDIPGSAEITVDQETIPILADEVTQYVGEPIALLVGPNYRELVSVAEDVQTMYEELEPVFDLHGDHTLEPVSARRKDWGDVDRGFSDSYQLVEGRYATGPQDHLASEPMGAFATYHDDGSITAFTATLWPYHVRRSLASALGIRESRCRVVGTDPGVNLDGKLWFPSVIAAQAAVASMLSNRPVKLMYSRQEDFLYSPKRTAVEVHYTTGLDPSGRCTTLQADIRINLGAYAVFTREILDRVLVSALGDYKIDNIRVRAEAFRTNLPPLNVCAGFGSSMGLFAMETHAARMAELSEQLPSEWKRANFLHRGDRAVTGKVLQAVPSTRQILDAVTEVSDFERKHAAYELQRKRRASFESSVETSRGIGIAIGHQGTGFIGRREDGLGASVRVRLEKDGVAYVRSSAVPDNPSILEIWRDTVARILALSREQVRISPIDTEEAPDSGPSVLSRNIGILNRLLQSCCETIKKQRFRNPLPIESGRNSRAPKTISWNEQEFSGTPYTSISRGCSVVEVEVSPLSLQPQVRAVWMVADAGRILDLDEARKSVEMGIFQALSWAQGEAVTFRDGALSPMDYQGYLPEPHADLPELWVRFVNTEERNPPKGLGELAFNSVPAAYVAAVSQATGRYLDRIPTTPALLQHYTEEP